MAYLLALSSAALYGAADFLGGLASRRANTLAIVVTSQGCGLTLLVLSLPLLPEATPTARDLVWGGAAGLAGGTGVTLLYRALAVGRMAVVAPTTAVCAVMIPVVTGVLLGERLVPLTILGVALAIGLFFLALAEQTLRQVCGLSWRRPLPGSPSPWSLTHCTCWLPVTGRSASPSPYHRLYLASTVILARIVLGERLNGWQVTGVACAVLAVALIVGPG